MSLSETVSNFHSPATLADEVRRRTGDNPARCYQCGKCSAGCPMAGETAVRPHDVMRLVSLDRRETLLDSESLWLCLTCETCTSRCPNQCDPARVIDALREIALAAGRPTPRRITAFHRAFLDQIRLTGRSFELGLIAEYKLLSGALLQDVMTAPGVVARGKLGFVPHTIRGIAEVRRIFAACDAARGEDA
jgi:heterodisulfide reductase subunit C